MLKEATWLFIFLLLVLLLCSAFHIAELDKRHP